MHHSQLITADLTAGERSGQNTLQGQAEHVNLTSFIDSATCTKEVLEFLTPSVRGWPRFSTIGPLPSTHHPQEIMRALHIIKLFCLGKTLVHQFTLTTSPPVGIVPPNGLFWDCDKDAI